MSPPDGNHERNLQDLALCVEAYYQHGLRSFALPCLLPCALIFFAIPFLVFFYGSGMMWLALVPAVIPPVVVYRRRRDIREIRGYLKILRSADPALAYGAMSIPRLMIACSLHAFALMAAAAAIASLLGTAEEPSLGITAALCAIQALLIEISLWEFRRRQIRLALCTFFVGAPVCTGLLYLYIFVLVPRL